MFPTFSVADSSRSNRRSSRSRQAAGLPPSGPTRSTHQPSQVLFEDPPNNFFPDSLAATKYMQHCSPPIHSPLVVPYPTPSPEPFRSTRLPPNDTFGSYSMVQQTPAPSPKCDAGISPVACVVSPQLGYIYTGLPSPASTPPHTREYPIYTISPSPSPHANNHPNTSVDAPHRTQHSRPEYASGHTRRLSSSRTVPYPNQNARLSISNQGASNGVRKRSVTDHAAIFHKRSPTICTGNTMINWSRLRPGQELILLAPHDVMHLGPHPTPADLEMVGIHPDVVTCTPRSSDYLGVLDDYGRMIEFCSREKPGPSIAHLLKGSVCLDGGHERVFESFGWKTTRIGFDWPGLSRCVQGLEENVSKLTRADLAVMVANIIETTIHRARNHPKVQVIDQATKKWDLQQVNLRKLRLLSLNYYHKVWIPVLAIDF